MLLEGANEGATEIALSLSLQNASRTSSQLPNLIKKSHSGLCFVFVFISLSPRLYYYHFIFHDS